MEDLYSIHPGILPCRKAEEPTATEDAVGAAASASSSSANSDLTDVIKAQIAGHPRYPYLVSAYIECIKVGAPPEVASLLEEIGREKNPKAASQIGADPELDEFMESYCQLLIRYKEELSKPFDKSLRTMASESYCQLLIRYKEELAKPFDEASSFLNDIELQLTDLCMSHLSAATATGSSPSDEVVGSSEENVNYGDTDAPESRECGMQLIGNELKEMLLKKYSGYLSNLRREFLKKRKKEKLPKDARSTLLEWWNGHSRWPYPMEEEKAKLADKTGLDQKQINNWFINQRKRHWKPSEDMRFALMEEVGSGGCNSAMLHLDTGTVGP